MDHRARLICHPIPHTDGRHYCPRCDPYRRRPLLPNDLRLCHPTLWTTASRLVADATQWLAAGAPLTPTPLAEARLATCRQCPYYHPTTDHCDLCGCNMSLKARMATTECPANRWPTYITIRNDAPPADRRYPSPSWITIDHLIRDALTLADEIAQYDAIYALPRSGLLPATALATRLAMPLYAMTPDGPQPLNYGYRSAAAWAHHRPTRPVILDDTAFTGHAMRPYRDSYPTATVYTTDPSLVTHYAYILPPPHWLDWHYWHSPHMANAILDLDGIITANETGRLLRRPVAPLAICTARGPEFADETRRLLARLGLADVPLYMAKDATIYDPEASAQYKAPIYAQSRADQFVESEDQIARRIAELAHKTVICPTTATVYYVP